MSPVLPLLAMLAVAYVLGSVNFAIPIARWVAGVDIRTVGNLNPGASNTYRVVGKGWGLLVGFLDGLKSFLPMGVGRSLFFPGEGWFDALSVAAMGIAAVLGHCKPVFFDFKGGKGAGSVVGAFLFLVPVELLAAFVIGVGLVALLFRNVAFRWGRWVPMMAIVLTPFLTLGVSLVPGLPIDHSAAQVTAVFAVSLFTMALNLGFLKGRVAEAREQPGA